MCDQLVRVLGIAPLSFAIFGGLMAFNRATVYSIIERYTYDFFSKGNIIRTDQYVEKMTDYAMETVKPVGMAIFVVAILLMVISIYGQSAATCSPGATLIPYLVFLSAMVIVEVSLLIVYALKRGELADTYVAHFKEASTNYRSLQSSETDSLFAGLVMASEKCCGYENGEEFLSSAKLSPNDTFRNISYTNMPYPITCCAMDRFGTGDPKCPSVFTLNNSNIDVGCAKPLHDTTIYYLNIMAYSSLIIFFYTIITLINDAVSFGVWKRGYSLPHEEDI